MPVIPATWEAEAGESLEPQRWRLQEAVRAPQHCIPAWVTEQDHVPQKSLGTKYSLKRSVNPTYEYIFLYQILKALIYYEVKIT